MVGFITELAGVVALPNMVEVDPNVILGAFLPRIKALLSFFLFFGAQRCRIFRVNGKLLF